MMDVLINLMVGTLSQHIHISDDHVVHFKCHNFICQLYLIKAEKKSYQKVLPLPKKGSYGRINALRRNINQRAQSLVFVPLGGTILRGPSGVESFCLKQ